VCALGALSEVGTSNPQLDSKVVNFVDRGMPMNRLGIGSLILLAVVSGCDESPSRKAVTTEQERLKSYQGYTGFVWVYKERTEAVWYHLRGDCPKLDEQLKSISKGKAVPVRFDDGKIVDEKGFFYTGIRCERCCH
jgi:hypothetical protein